VYARKINDNVAPLSKLYRINKKAATWAFSLLIPALIVNTKPNSPIIKTQNTIGFLAIMLNAWELVEKP
jgi:hypothetical protein